MKQSPRERDAFEALCDLSGRQLMFLSSLTRSTYAVAEDLEKRIALRALHFVVVAAMCEKARREKLRNR